MTVSRDDYPHRHLTRRGFIQTFAAVSAGLALSVACGQQAPAPAKPAESKPAEAAKPTEAAKPAAPAAPVAQATTAPAAAPAAAKPADAVKPAAAAAGAPTRGGTIRVGLYVEAVTMDPHLSGSKIDRQVFNNLYEKLVDLDNKLAIIPGLAESWSQPDPQTLVFKLRQGVKFHDGTDFNAEAVKFNFDRMQNPETKSLRTGEIANVDHAEVVDPSTVKLVLKRPDASLLATLTDRAGMMLSPTAVQKFGPDFTRNPVGTGPFQFVDWVKDDHLALKRFDGYWDKAAGPYLDGVRYRTIPDDTVKLQSLMSGELDVMDYLAPRDVAQVKANQSLVEVDVPSLADFGYYFNTTKPPFDNKSLRLAVAYAIDVTAIVKGVWLDVGVPANGPIPPSSWAYDSSIKPVQRDIAKAKQYLAEGGKPDGFTFTVENNNIPIAVQEMEAMKAQMAEAGITMEIQLVDSARLQADQNARTYDLTSSTWSGRPDPDGNTYQFFHTTPGISSNVSGFSNPQADEILEKTRTTSDQGERKKLYSQLVQLLRDEMPRLEIIHPVEPKAFSPKVQAYDPVPDGMMRFKNVWLK